MVKRLRIGTERIKRLKREETAWADWNSLKRRVYVMADTMTVWEDM